MSPWGYRGRIISLLAGVATSLLVVNSSDAKSRVRFHTVNASFVVAPVYVGRHGPFEFLVDTGTNTTLISADLATELELKPIGDGLLATVTGPETVPRYFLDSVSLGTQSVPRLTVLAQRMKELHALNPGIRGVLGLDFLLGFAFLLDYGHQQIELYDASETPCISPAGTRQPIQLVQGRILVSAATEASVGGSWNLALDSGISRVAVFENAIRSSQDPRQDGRGTVRVTTNLSSVSTSIAKVQDLAIGDIHVRDLPVVILPKSPTLQRDVEDGLLPTMLFRYIFVNPKRGYVIFELNDAFVSRHRNWCMFCGNQKP